MNESSKPSHRRFGALSARVDPAVKAAQRTVVWRIWERMLEIEFVDRSVALAGKGFVSFFPLIIVVAAFMPVHVRTAIFSTLTRRLGIHGSALVTARQAFASSDHIKQATGFLGLLLTIFFAAAFTTALQRIYLRAWRRPKVQVVRLYSRGLVWLTVMLTSMAILGGVHDLFGDDAIGTIAFVVVSFAVSTGVWVFTAWLMLMGDIRTRVLIPSGVVTGVALALYAYSARLWMPGVVERNAAQFGFFGVGLALVTWFAGAAVCVLIGACAGAAIAEDPGFLGRLVRSSNPDILREGAEPSLPAPMQSVRLRDALNEADDGP